MDVFMDDYRRAAGGNQIRHRHLSVRLYEKYKLGAAGLRACKPAAQAGFILKVHPEGTPVLPAFLGRSEFFGHPLTMSPNSCPTLFMLKSYRKDSEYASGFHRRQGRPRAQPQEYRCQSSRGISWWSSPAFPARGKARWLSIPSTPKASAATWSRSPPMPASSWAGWKSRMSTTSKG